MRFKTTQETTEKVEKIIERLLAERFKDEVVFGPVIAQPDFDHDDDEILRICIVFDGEQKRLDPHWTNRIEEFVRQEIPEDDLPLYLSHMFEEKSEWEEFLEPKYRETGRLR